VVTGVIGGDRMVQGGRSGGAIEGDQNNGNRDPTRVIGGDRNFDRPGGFFTLCEENTLRGNHG